MKDFPFASDTQLVIELTSRLQKDLTLADAVPDAGQVCSVINTTFWASMQTEEGRSVRASLVLVSPEYSRSGDVFRFSNPVELSSDSITKLSASFPFRRGAIAITFPPQGRPLIWGFVLPKPQNGWLVEIMGPGHLVVRNAPSIEAALLPGGKQIVFPENTRLEDEWCDLVFWRGIFRNQIPFQLQTLFYDFLRLLSRTMIEHRRGGTLVVVSPTDQTWRRAIDFTYKFSKPEEYLSNLVSELRKWRDKWYQDQDGKRKAKGENLPEITYYPDSEPEQERRLHEAIRLVGGLTAVDGAMVITPDLKILGYGAKLKVPSKQLKVREWLPYSHYASEPTPLFGGTRHRSAAQFVLRHPESTIFVASQDGRFTIFCCDEAGYEVIAHRVELLLL